VSNRNPSLKRVVVVIEEAAQKCIRELRVEEPYAKSEEVYVTIKFDDDTEIVLDLTSRLRFGVQFVRCVDGELEPVKAYPKRFLRK
jgi:hypothetical protein